MRSRARACLGGSEVPVVPTNSINWFTVSIPSSSYSSTISPSPPSKDYAFCSLTQNPPAYFIFRTSPTHPNVLTLTLLHANQDLPRNGLRIVYPDALLPFAFIFNNHSSSSYTLYTLTVSGVAYLLTLRNTLNYSSCSTFSSDEVTEFDTRIANHLGEIVSVTATQGCLLVGRNDGTVSCFRLGVLHPTSPGFASLLRDDGGFTRLWGIMSRNRMAAPVLDVVVSEFYQKKFLIVLHSDGCLRVWDLLSQHRIFTHTLTNLSSQGTLYLKLWAGEANHDSNTITLAVCHKYDASELVISIYNLSLNFGDKIVCSLEPLSQCISLEVEPVDVRITANKVWILKKDGLMMQELLNEDTSNELLFYYTLEEAYIAEQLFQCTEHSSDDLLWLANTVFSSSKDRIVPFLSSIFLRRLLLPGVHDKEVLRQTLHHYNIHLRDSEISCLTVAGVKNEILSVIESEGGSENPFLVLQCWKNFCMHYFRNWCKYNEASGMFSDSSSGAVSLIRRHTLSLCRALEEVEVVNSGSFDEQNDIVSSGVHFPGDDLDREILNEVLQCIGYFSQQLGKVSSAMFYEALLSVPDTSEEVLSQLLKVLESGISASVATRHISELGAGVVLEKEVLSHKNLRKFSMDMFVGLHSLRSKAASWDKVLDVIEIYLQFLVPRKIEHRSDSQAAFSINSSTAVQATSQVAKVMFDSALDVLILLSYMVKISGQIYMSHADVSKIKLEFIPMIQELVTEWHIVHFFGTTPSESPAFEDFNLQLSSLKIDGNVNKKPWNEKLGKCEFTLALILLVYSSSSCGLQSDKSSVSLRHPRSIVDSVREFASWIIWGSTGKESPVFFSHAIDIALVLLKHGQYDAVEYLLTMVDAYSRKEKISESLQISNGAVWASLHHLLGCCLISKSQGELHAAQKERKVSEAVRCFFRVASAEGASEALKSLSSESGWPTLDYAGYVSGAAWKLHYYQWAMQLFEQYNMSEAACQFALAALEQVDEAASSIEDGAVANAGIESATIIRGRLWANVFKFTLDRDLYYDAYCAIISNPDEESKSICLRRFIIVLYERGAMKVLCDGQLPFVGLTEKVEQELAWKAQRSDVSAKPNPYKILYAFEMHRHNWRGAANYIYQYTALLKHESPLKDTNRRSLALQERLDGLSAAINALQLVHPAYAWIELPVDLSHPKNDFPNKKARMTSQDQTSENDSLSQKPLSYIDIEKLESEYVLASAEYLLCLANAKWNSTGNEKTPSDIVDLLVDSSIYDLAFTMILKFWKGSALNRALERIFAAMSLKCCASRLGHSVERDNHLMHGFLLTASEDEDIFNSHDAGPAPIHPTGSNHWETLEHYLDKYKKYHQRLPVIVAETLLAADPQIELPLWLVQMFKGARRESSRGMSGNDSDPASLLRLYVDYGRYLEATTLILDYIESLASMRPVDILHRKKPFSVWFPYATIGRLWSRLEESIKLGHMIDQSEKLKKLLHGALLNHLNLVKVDSDDVLSAQ